MTSDPEGIEAARNPFTARITGLHFKSRGTATYKESPHESNVE